MTAPGAFVGIEHHTRLSVVTLFGGQIENSRTPFSAQFRLSGEPLPIQG